MITVHVRELAEKRLKVKNAHQFGLALGLTPSWAARLWNATFTRVDLDTLDRLCEALGCQPGQILKHTANEE